jgi:hypothetical protein
MSNKQNAATNVLNIPFSNNENENENNMRNLRIRAPVNKRNNVNKSNKTNKKNNVNKNAPINKNTEEQIRLNLGRQLYRKFHEILKTDPEIRQLPLRFHTGAFVAYTMENPTSTLIKILETPEATKKAYNYGKEMVSHEYNLVDPYSRPLW